MRKIISVFVLGFISTTFFGQTISSVVAIRSEQNVSPVFLKNSEFQNYQLAKPPGLKMRNTARVLTIVGVSLFIGGVILFSSADDKYYRSTYTSSTGTVSEGDPKAGFGTIMMATGIGMTVPGIIFWVKGSRRYKKHLEQEGQASVQFKGNGLALNYRF